MHHLKSIILTFLFLIICFDLFSQVTIGSKYAPRTGVLLDLKENEVVDGGQTSTKGLGLPRVALVSIDDLSPCAANTSENKLSHRGLTVYNVTTDSTKVLKEGLYFWDGELWQLTGTKGAQGFGPWYQVENPNLPSREVTTNSYLNAKAVVGGTDVLNNATLSVNGDAYIKGNQQITEKLGINKKDPIETNLDVDGSVAFRNLPTLEIGSFTDIGVNNDGILYKRNQAFTSYSVYLGFDPMAKSHTDTIPLHFQDGYMYKLEGIAVGACQGVLISYTILFIGNKYSGATLQASTTKVGSTDKYNPVVLSATEDFWGKYLEVLAGAGSCGEVGHQLSYDGVNLIVTFTDDSPYYLDAGTFAITNLIQVKITN